MKIAVVVNSLKVGGMERVAVNLTNAFHKAGHDVELIYLKDRPIELQPDDPSVPVHLFDVKKAALLTGFGALWMMACRLANIFARKSYARFFAYAECKAFAKSLSALEASNNTKFDLIVFRGHGTFEHVWPLQDPRFVFVCESVQGQHHYGRFSQRAFQGIYGNRNMVCISQGVMENFQAITKLHDIHPRSATLISNPLEYDRIAEQSQADKNHLHPRPYILGLGRLSPIKNVPLLVEAYHILVNRFGVTQDLVIVGEGRERAAIEEKVAQLGLSNRVFLKGQQMPPYPWFAHADLFTLSSKSEGLGMVLIEALACGAPVAATRCPGGVSQIMQGPLSDYLADMTPEALAQAMYNALTTPHDEAYQAAVQSSLAQFDGQRIVQTYLDTFTTDAMQ